MYFSIWQLGRVEEGAFNLSVQPAQAPATPAFEIFIRCSPRNTVPMMGLDVRVTKMLSSAAQVHDNSYFRTL